MEGALRKLDDDIREHLASAKGYVINTDADGLSSVDVAVPSHLAFPVVPGDECALKMQGDRVVVWVAANGSTFPVGSIARDNWPAPPHAERVECVAPHPFEPRYRVCWNS